MKALLLIIAILVTNQLAAQKIDSIRCYSIDTKTGEKKHTKTEYYNASNKLAKTIKYYQQKEEGVEEYSYDENKNLIEYVNTKNGKKYIVKSEYKGGLLIEEEVLGFSNYFRVFEYNEQGDVVLEKKYADRTKIDRTIETQYVYEKGKAVRVNIFETMHQLNDRPEMRQQKHLSYNDKGLLVKEEVQSRFYRYEYAFVYDDNDKLKKKTTERDNEKIIEVSNENGQRILEKIYRKKSKEEDYVLEQTNSWEYDKYGNEIESKVERGELMTKQEKKEIFYKK